VTRLAVFAAIGAMVMSLAAAPALANTPTISGAPAVAYGQQAFGNTAGAGSEFGGLCWGEGRVAKFWTLTALAGDAVKIQWEHEGSAVEHMLLWPVGTDDFNVTDTRELVEDFPGDNDRSEANFIVPVSGTMPLAFLRCADLTGGPYSFTAYVRHAVKLFVPQMNRLRRTATISVGAHTPDGGVISDPALIVDVQVRSTRRWRTVGSATVSNSVASVSLSIPRRFGGERVALRALAHGDSYRNAATRPRKVRIR
jgi:hypothetical protein